MTTLASQQLWIGLGIVGFLFVSLTMILIVLIQKPQGGGLSGAFGSSSDGGAGQTAFGAKTGDVLTTLTISIFIVFLVSAAGLNYVVRPSVAPLDEETSAVGDSEGTSGAPGIRTEGGEPIEFIQGEGPIPGFEDGQQPEIPSEDPNPAPDTETPQADPPISDDTAVDDSGNGETPEG